MPEEIKNETTNAVLAVKLDSFKELVDTKFGNVQSTLTRIENSTGNFVSKKELEEVKKDFTDSIKRIENDFVNHNKDDKDNFGNITKQIAFLIKVVFVGMGGLAVITFFIPFVIHWLHWG